jgi:thioredoxin reductase-like selenoprotein T
MTMKQMLETSFPGIHVILGNYPPPFPKRALSKAVPLLQVGAMATLMACDQIFPRFGMVPPPWYYSLRANRFGTMASIWLFGNFAQSFLQSSGAFEVYCNGQLVCSL